MAKWSDVVEAERKQREAVATADKVTAELERVIAFIRETEQVDAFMEWYAKRLGIWATLYDTNGQSPPSNNSQADGS